MQVLKNSRRNVARVRDVSSFIDVSDVQHHVCNGRKVVYLNKWSDNEASLRRCYRRPACAACKRKLKHGYKFCSIECRVRGLMTFLPLIRQL